MRCNEFEQRLAEVSAGRLGSTEERIWLQHAESCPKCSRLLATVRGEYQIDPPRELLEDIVYRTSGGTCREAGRLLCDYVDATLPPGEDLLLRGHLQVCPKCRALADSLALSHALLPELVEVDPGPSFAEAVFERTDRLPVHPQRPVEATLAFARSLFLRPRFALEAAYVGALLLFGLYGLIPGEALQPQLFSAGPVPTEFHQSATKYAAEAVEDLSNGSRKLGGLASSWVLTAGDTLSIYTARTLSGLEEDYDGARIRLVETWQNTRRRLGKAWYGPADDQPGI